MSKNIRLLTFDENRKSITNEKVIIADEISIETKNNVYDLENVKQYFNDKEGTIYYILNVDLPAKVESERLKTLRRSMALHNIFKYDTKKPFDLFKLIPYLIILAMIIFG